MSQPVELFSQVTGIKSTGIKSTGPSAGDAPQTVILLHGLFGMSDNLGQLAKVLNDNYQVHRLDLRNHGRSGRSDSMALADMAGDIRHYMAQNGIGRAAIVGHSLGGKVALQLALQQVEELIGFVVADIAPVQYQSHHDGVLNGLNNLDLSAIGNRAEADASLSKYIHEPGVRQFLLKNLYLNEQRQFGLRMNLPVITKCYPQVLKAPEGTPCNFPALFIKGENSDYITAGHSEVIKELFPQLHFKMISGTGHWLHAEKPEIFNRLVTRFLDEEILWAE